MIPPILCHDRHHHEELPSREPDPSTVCPVTAFSKTETPCTPHHCLFPAPITSTVKILLAQRSSHLDFFFHLVSTNVCSSKTVDALLIVFHALNFLFFRAKKGGGTQHPPNGLYTQCFTLGCAVYVLCEKSMQ